MGKHSDDKIMILFISFQMTSDYVLWENFRLPKRNLKNGLHSSGCQSENMSKVET